jgi:hypothetical protein
MDSNSMSPPQEHSEGQDRVSSAVRAARRERKRQTDREAQRHRRARTRSHVAHLEKTVKDLTEALEKQEKASWPRTLQQQHLQIERLGGVLETIYSLAQQARGIASPSLNCPKEIPEIQNRFSHKSLGFMGKGEDTLSSPEPMDCAAADGSPSPASLPNDRDSRSQRAITPENAQLRRQLMASPGDKNQNYFELINNALNALQERTVDLPSSSFENDEDIAIRVVVNGWETARQKYKLDEGWAVLETFDEGLFNNSGSVERMAMLRLMRAIFVVSRRFPCHTYGISIANFYFNAQSKVNTSNHLHPSLPPYMTPT